MKDAVPTTADSGSEDLRLKHCIENNCLQTRIERCLNARHMPGPVRFT
jgi:hypothetical protein